MNCEHDCKPFQRVPAQALLARCGSKQYAWHVPTKAGRIRRAAHLTSTKLMSLDRIFVELDEIAKSDGKFDIGSGTKRIHI